MKRPMRALLLAVTIGIAAPATGQLLGGGGLSGIGSGLGGLTGGLTGAQDGHGVIGAGLSGTLTGVGDTLRSLSPDDLLSLRRVRLHELVKDNRDLDVDDAGNPIRRDEILALGLAPDALEKAKAAGFTVGRHETVDGLGLDVTVLAPPRGKAARKSIEVLRKADPEGNYTLDHVYEPARAPLAPAKGPTAGGGFVAGATMGLIDGGVGQHPAFAGAAIEQRGFAGAPKPSGHGTAVASLMIGRAGEFRGAAPGTALLVADVYGGSAANGSADAIVHAMGWLAQRGARVINISLVGPPNSLLEAGVKALQAKGILLVAAVGNDGPAAPPQFPASYPGVVSVTGVDAKGKALIEAGKPLHLDFAAPGADMAGAVPGGGWEVLRGTSFASPLVAASLARIGGTDKIAELGREAQPGGGKIGRGIVCGDCRTPPNAVGLK